MAPINGGCSLASRVPDCDFGGDGCKSHQPPHTWTGSSVVRASACHVEDTGSSPVQSANLFSTRTKIILDFLV